MLLEVLLQSVLLGDDLGVVVVDGEIVREAVPGGGPEDGTVGEGGREGGLVFPVFGIVELLVGEVVEGEVGLGRSPRSPLPGAEAEDCAHGCSGYGYKLSSGCVIDDREWAVTAAAMAGLRGCFLGCCSSLYVVDGWRAGPLSSIDIIPPTLASASAVPPSPTPAPPSLTTLLSYHPRCISLFTVYISISV